jgi:sec-independent protein translocase protein TatA
LEEIVAGITPWHLVLVLVVILLFVGPGKLPETGAAIGKALRDLRNAVGGNEPPADGTQ